MAHPVLNHARGELLRGQLIADAAEQKALVGRIVQVTNAYYNGQPHGNSRKPLKGRHFVVKGVSTQTFAGKIDVYLDIGKDVPINLDQVEIVTP